MGICESKENETKVDQISQKNQLELSEFYSIWISFQPEMTEIQLIFSREYEKKKLLKCY